MAAWLHFLLNLLEYPEPSCKDAATVAPQRGERCDYRNPVDTPKGNHGSQLQRRPQGNHRTSHQELELHRNTTQRFVRVPPGEPSDVTRRQLRVSRTICAHGLCAPRDPWRGPAVR